MTSPPTRPWKRFGRTVKSGVVTAERAPVAQILKAAIAAIATWSVCLIAFPEQFPIFGVIAALLCVQENVSQSLVKGVERFAGVVVGVSVGIGAGLLFGSPAWLFILALIASLTIGWVVRMPGPSTTQIAISSMLVIALGEQDLGYAWERIVETAVGAAIGVVVNAFIVAPVRTTPAHEAVFKLVNDTADALHRIASALSEKQSPAQMADLLAQARELQRERENVHLLLRHARESLRLNPRGQKYRALLAADDALFQRAQHIVSQVLGMSRALHDGYSPDLVDDRAVIGLAGEMKRAAHDLRQLALLRNPQVSASIEPPLLTAPYEIIEPNPEHWVLIGSLMEDLRRIRNRIFELQGRGNTDG